MNEKLEQVARGIHLRRANSRHTKWEDCSEEYRTGTMRDAHAAIEAMREPTDAMIAAAQAVGIDQDPRDYWPAMVDEALK